MPNRSPIDDAIAEARTVREDISRLAASPTLAELLKDVCDDFAKTERVFVACERVLRVCHYGDPSEFDLAAAMEKFADQFEALAVDEDGYERCMVPESLCRAYPTLHGSPCVVCGDPGQAEPRFLYSVCAEHANVSPADIARRETA